MHVREEKNSMDQRRNGILDANGDNRRSRILRKFGEPSENSEASLETQDQASLFEIKIRVSSGAMDDSITLVKMRDGI